MIHRWFTGQAKLRDFIPLVFLWAQLFRSLFFSQAGYIHNFWVYYGVGFLAFGGADILEDLVVRLPAWLKEREWGPSWAVRAQQSASILVAVGILAAASVDTHKYFFEGHKTGGSLRLHYHEDFNRYVQYAHKIGEERPEGLLVKHNSFWKQHPQTDWYLGYPHIRTIRNGYVPSSFRGHEPTSIVFDIPRTHLFQWLDLMAKHPVLIIDKRLVLIDLTSDERRIEAIRAQHVEPSIWYRYWTNYFIPPIEWVDDPEEEARFRSLYERNVEPPDKKEDDRGVRPSLKNLNPGKETLERINSPSLKLHERLKGPGAPADDNKTDENVAD
jgi:hypothetical protein